MKSLMTSTSTTTVRAESDEMKLRDSIRRGAGDSDVEKCFENFYCSGNVVSVVVQ